MNPINSTKSRQSGRVSRWGAAGVEMGLVLFMLVLLVFGIIEMGRMIMVNQVLTNAAREGARRAVIPGATNQQVTDRIDDYMSAAIISGYTTTIQVDGSPGALSTAPSHSQVTVAISVPYDDVSYGAMQLISPGKILNSTVVMRKE